MASYIDKTYVETMLSAAQVAALLSYGDITSSTVQDAKMNAIISQASSIVDSFLVPAGYDLPLATTPEVIKGITFWLSVNQLYASCQQPLPEHFQAQVNQSYGMLEALRDKKMVLNGLSQNISTGTGGNMFVFAVSDGDIPLNMSREKLRGTFF